MSATSPRFVGYWLGYVSNPQNLNALYSIPTAVTNVNLFVAGITNDGLSLNTNYLCKDYPSSQLIEWSGQLQAQGTAVSMTLMDSGTIHWNNVNIPSYVASVNSVALGPTSSGGWGLNGIDIDAESGMDPSAYVATMVDLVNSMRNAIGGDALLTYTCYTYGMQVNGMGSDSNFDAEILPQIAGSLNWINTMGYFWDSDQQITAFNAYANLIGADKVCIGVGCGYGDGTDFTPLEECSSLAAWQPQGTTKRGMMLFNENNDCPTMSQQPVWTWTDAIANNLTSVARAARRRPRPHRQLPLG